MTNNYSKNKHCECRKLISNKAILCRSCSCKERYKNNKNHPLFGKHHSKETRRKISIKARKRLSIPENNPNFGKRHLGMNKGRKHTRETKNKMSQIRIINKISKGRNNPNWRGGLSEKGYSFKFNNLLKEQIRQRDNHICQNCGITEKNI